MWKNVRRIKGTRVLKSSLWILAWMGAFTLFWWLFALSVEAVRHIPFPMPDAVVMRLVSLLSGESVYDTSLFSHFTMSLKRWLIAYSIAVFFGVTLGTVCGFFEKALFILMKFDINCYKLKIFMKSVSFSSGFFETLPALSIPFLRFPFL